MKMTKNVKITLTIPEELERRFRETIANTLGFKRGNLQIAIMEAIQDWIKKQEKR